MIFVSIFFCTAASTFAQLKIGYIQSERIRTEYEEFTEAESQLQMEYQKVQVEYEKMIMQLDSLNKDYEVKRLMALDKGESIKQQIMQMERAIQTYQAEKVGPQGELMKKSAQMEYEILGKVREAVMLSKVIVGIAGFIAVVTFPPIVLVGIVGWAGWTLYKNYTV